MAISMYTDKDLQKMIELKYGTIEERIQRAVHNHRKWLYVTRRGLRTW